MSVFTDGVDKLRNIALDEHLSKIGIHRSDFTDEQFATSLEEAIVILKTLRIYRPDKIISRALMIPSYRRLIKQLRSTPN